MCGIVGYHSLLSYQDTLEDKLALIAHRGPDGEGVFEIEYEESRVAYGHRRLTIIDLSSAADQPFISNCGRYVIVFNGEIYNYKILKERLKEYTFNTTSDTEVLLNYFIEYGVEGLKDLEGMFVFAIHDKQRKETVCVRDQLGIKPLYLYKDDEKFIFASELKAIFAFEGITKRVDPSLYTEFLLNGFMYEPDTGFQDVQKLMPATYLLIRSNKGKIEYESHRYWSVDMLQKEEAKNLEQAIKHSIKQHLMSDVPIGLFFSGGIDSSIILSQLLNSKIKLLTVQSDKRTDLERGVSNDAHYASLIAQRLKQQITFISLTETISNNNDFLSAIDQVSQLVEEPIADFTFISSLQLSQEARKQGMIVMLSGMGADEVFAGYDRYRLVAFEKYFRLLKPIASYLFGHTRWFSKKIERFHSFLEEKEFALKYSSLIGYFSPSEVKKLLPKSDFQNYLDKLNQYIDKEDSNLKKSLILDSYGFLSHNFLVADKSSMQASIEMRVPLATADLLNLSFRLPKRKLLSLFHAKLPLRKLLYNYLPKKVVNRPKAGFNPPLDQYVENLGADLILQTFQKNQLYKVLSSSYIEEIVKQHFESSRYNHTYKIYQLLFFSYWLRNNIHA